MSKLFRILFLVPLLFLPATAQADPVVPALTIIGGTVTGGRGTLPPPNGISVIAGINLNLVAIDPVTGTVFNIHVGSEGTFFGNPFAAGPGQTVTFVSSVLGNADFGFAILKVNFSGFGPPIPNVIQPTLDLEGFGTATIEGTFFANSSDEVNNVPLFTIPSQSFSGSVRLHFIALAPGDPRFELRNATLTIPEPVPEPASVILLLTSVGGLGLFGPARNALKHRLFDRSKEN